MIRFTLRATGIGAVPFPNCHLPSNPGQGTRSDSRREPDRIASPIEPFLDVRAAVITERIGDGGIGTCAALTDSLDEALQALGAALTSDAAIIALGGCGRREHCIWSDVDVMVLHRGR